jgi:hypothetical protein
LKMINFFKRISKIYKWILISIIFQFLLLLFINNVWLDRKIDKANLKMTNYEDGSEGVSTLQKGKSLRLELPEGTVSGSVSFDGNYLAYLKDNKIEIVDLNKNQKVHTIDGSFIVVDRIKDRESFDAVISYFEWLNDRNTLIFSVRAPDGQEGVVQLATYNVESGETHGFPPAMYKLPAGSEAVEIEYSTKTNVIYVKVKVRADGADIYRYNILDQISYVFSTDIGIIYYKLSLTDNFVFQDKKNKLAVWNGEKSEIIPIPVEKNVILLGIGAGDTVLVGELNNDYIERIYYGKIDQDFLEWNSIDTGSPVLPKDIVVSPDGKIYKKDSEAHTLTEIPTGGKLNYNGKFLQITDNYIISTDGNFLIIHRYH